MLQRTGHPNSNWTALDIAISLSSVHMPRTARTILRNPPPRISRKSIRARLVRDSPNCYSASPSKQKQCTCAVLSSLMSLLYMESKAQQRKVQLILQATSGLSDHRIRFFGQYRGNIGTSCTSDEAAATQYASGQLTPNFRSACIGYQKSVAT